MNYTLEIKESQMNKINLLLVVNNNVLNGTERYVVDLSKNLPKDKFNVFVAVPLKGPLSEILAENNIRELLYDNGKTNGYSFKGFKNLYRLMKEHKIDIVHTNAKSYPCIIGKLAGVRFNTETRHGIFYTKKMLEKLPLVRKVYEYFKQFFVDEFIATSENDKATLMKYFNIKEKKISVIYLGIDFEKMKEKCTGVFKTTDRKSGSPFMIGHIGRMTFQKAQEYLLQAFETLSKKYPNIMLTIVGTGEDEQTLRKFVEEKSLHNKVIFKGYIEDIYNEMKNYDVHVLTSRFEGTGYVNLEAMALGVPVITSEVGGATNFFTNCFDSMITKSEDPVSTANAIEMLINDENLRKKIIVNAFSTVSRYTVKRMAEETAEYYIKNLQT